VKPLLFVEDLAVAFDTDDGELLAVDGVSLTVAEGEAVGLVGESGCGKSVTSLAVMRLLPEPPARIARGKIVFGGRDLASAPESELRALRGQQIAMIFQEPMTALNPVLTVGAQIGEGLRHHRGLSASEAWKKSVELLVKVGIPGPEERAHCYPHQLSGGMRQRVMIATALACGPKLLLADEPTTALDVTIQAQILDLLASLRRELSMSLLLVTHDLGVVADFVDRVVVMYAGKVVEEADVGALFASPRHPYTRGLLKSVPGFGDNAAKKRLPTIRGVVPDLRTIGKGCRFRERCDERVARCDEGEPPLVELATGHRAACFVAQGADA
jgi:oligopeptide/dipeptide ABC transporter ATP-binding protein